MAQTTDVTDVELRAADYDFRIRIYPAENPTGEMLVWLHGGAFMFGDLEMPEADATARGLAERGIPVASVDYTLASLEGAAALPPIEPIDDYPLPEALIEQSTRPRAGFPVASLQTMAAFDWAVAHAAELGADPARVALGGASAGGNLAAGAAVRIRDRRDTRPLCQVLVYPVLHAVLPPPDEGLRALLATLPAWMRFPPESIRVINGNYLGEASGDDPYAFPAGHDLAGSVPALLVSAEADELRPSAEDYADQLSDAGVEFEYVMETDATHGFLNMPGHPSQVATIERIGRFLQNREVDR